MSTGSIKATETDKPKQHRFPFLRGMTENALLLIDGFRFLSLLWKESKEK